MNTNKDRKRYIKSKKSIQLEYKRNSIVSKWLVLSKSSMHQYQEVKNKDIVKI